MNYPGNPALSEDAQRRVLSTFESMLREVADGNIDDALMGCTFIERLDPTFAPVADLRSRIEGAGGNPVDVQDLIEAVGTGFEREELTTLDGGQIETVETETFEPAPQIEVMRTDETVAIPSIDPVPTTDQEIEDDLQVQPNLAADEDTDKVQAQPNLDTDEELKPDPVAEPPSRVDLASDMPQTEEAVPEELVAEPAVDQDPMPDDRVAALLAEGQTAFDAGEYQTAIDAWSRVFLIDLDHARANEKIEEARRRLAERDRQAEELFHAGLEKIEDGDAEGARNDLVAALELQPNHIGAQEHLERLEAGKASLGGEQASEGETPSAGDLSAESTAAIPPPQPRPAVDIESDTSTADIDLQVPEAQEPPRKTNLLSKLSLSPRFLVIAGVVLALVAVGAWYVFSQRQDLFPNAGDEPRQAAVRHPIDRAQRLHARGRLQAAIDSLEGIPATDPRHQEAQALLQKWQAEVADVDAATVEQEGQLSAEQAAEREPLIAQARTAVESGLFHRAIESLDQAAIVSPLSAEETSMRDLAVQRMEPYADAYLAYKDGDYMVAITPLWRTLRDSPDDAGAKELLIASHFNMARRALLGGSVAAAVDSLAEAAKLAPRDEQILQTLRFAEQYVGGTQDLRYRIFVKYLPQR